MATQRRDLVPVRTFYSVDPKAVVTFVRVLLPRNEARSYAVVYTRGTYSGRLAFARKDALAFARALGLHEHDGAGRKN